MRLSDPRKKLIATMFLAIGATTALLPPLLLLLTVYPVVFRLFTLALFPAASAIAFTLALLALLLFRSARHPTDLALSVVVLLAVNLLTSALVLVPGLLSAGCVDSTSPRPCGVLPGVCGLNIFTGIAAAIFTWGAVQQVRRVPPFEPPRT